MNVRGKNFMVIESNGLEATSLLSFGCAQKRKRQPQASTARMSATPTAKVAVTAAHATTSRAAATASAADGSGNPSAITGRSVT